MLSSGTKSGLIIHLLRHRKSLYRALSVISEGMTSLLLNHHYAPSDFVLQQEAHV